MSKGPAEIAHGPMLIGFVFNILLYGIMITQVYLYFTTFKQDRTWMKIFVVALFLADTVNAVFDFVYIYKSLIIHFNDVPFLAQADWVFATDPAITGIIATLVQLFFAWRVKILTNKWWLAGLVILCAIAGGVGGIVTAVEVGFTPYFVDFRHFKAVVILWLVAECLGDILITSILKKHKTGFQASDRLVDRIIRLTVQTGLITAMCASLDLVFFLTDPTGTHLIFNFPLSKLYTNSLMSSLNSRGGWKFGNGSGLAASPHGESCPPAAMCSAEQCKTNEIVHFHGTGPEVFVHVESHEMRDIERRRNSGARTYTSGSASDEKSPSTLQVRDQLQSTWEDDSDVQHGVGRINSSSEDGTGIV